jgi:hypothetical protein
MPTYKIVAEDGTWLTNLRLGVPDVRAGYRIPRGRDRASCSALPRSGAYSLRVTRAAFRPP